MAIIALSSSVWEETNDKQRQVHEETFTTWKGRRKIMPHFSS